MSWELGVGSGGLAIIVVDIYNESPERAIRVQPGVSPKGVTPG